MAAEGGELPISNEGREIYVNGLPADTTEEQLQEAFAEYGEIEETRLRRRARTNETYGFVLYTASESADAAINGKNGTAFAEGGEGVLEIALARERRQRQRRQRPQRERGPEDKTRLFCANLPWSTEDEQLQALFEGKGEIVEIEVAKRPDGRSRGFGFVKFASEADAAAAKESLEGVIINPGEENERELRLQYVRELLPAAEAPPAKAGAAAPAAQKKRKKRKPKVDPATIPNQVYCSNLPSDFKPSHLKHIFEADGAYEVIGKPFISRKKGDRPRYGFIQLGNADEVVRAIEDLNNAEFASEGAEDGGTWELKCEEARPREARPAQEARPKKQRQRKRKPRVDNSSRRVFVKGYPAAYTKEDVAGLFEGNVVSVKLRKPSNKADRPRPGYSHLVFETDEEAQAAVADKAGHSFGTKNEAGEDEVLIVEMSRPPRAAAGGDDAAAAAPAAE